MCTENGTGRTEMAFTHLQLHRKRNIEVKNITNYVD